jgi:hypothetical protein
MQVVDKSPSFILTQYGIVNVMETRRGSALIVLIIVVVIIIAFLAWWFVWQQGTAMPSSTQTPTTSGAATSSEIVEVPGNQMPIGIPSDLPMDTNAQVLQNFQTNYPNTQAQMSVREYVTQDTLAQAYADYMNYFENNGWQIISSSSLPGVDSLAATQNLTTLATTFSNNSQVNENTVQIQSNYYISTSTYTETNVPMVMTSATEELFFPSAKTP